MPVPSTKLQSTGPIKFSDLNTEFRGSVNANTQLSMSQLGYGSTILRSNNCTAQVRSNSSSPYYTNIGLLQTYNGAGSNMTVSNYYSKWIYSAPPNGTFVLTGTNDQYNFSTYYSSGRDYSPNTDKKNTNPLFIEIINNGTCYSNTKGGATSAASIPNASGSETGGTLVYFDNNTGIYGSAGDGGNGGNGTSTQSGGAGGAGGRALTATCERLYLNNDGVIYGGGGGGGGGGSGHETFNQFPGFSPTNQGNGGGGGGGGQGYVAGSGGGGGSAGANFGNAGNAGSAGSFTSAGSGGAGGNGPGPDGGAGGGGGGWGSAGGNGGGSGSGGNGGSGGAAGSAIVATTITYVNAGTTAGPTTPSTPF